MSRARKPASRRAESRPEPPPETASGLGNFLRRQRELANISLRKMAEQSNVSASVIRDIESGLRHPSRTLLQSLATALRLSAETLYLQAGVLDPKDIGDTDAVREILRDPNLTERQRDILVEIYAAFRITNHEHGNHGE